MRTDFWDFGYEDSKIAWGETLPYLVPIVVVALIVLVIYKRTH